MLNDEFVNEFYKKICIVFDKELKDPNSKQLFENLKCSSNATQSKYEGIINPFVIFTNLDL